MDKKYGDFKLWTVDEKDYVLPDIVRLDNGDALLEMELKQRILKLKVNIEKCGSFQKLEEMGGNPTQTFLKKTRNLLRNFLFMYQVENLLTTVEDIQSAIKCVNECDAIFSLVEKASWNNILDYAQQMRNTLVDQVFTRSIQCNTLEKTA